MAKLNATAFELDGLYSKDKRGYVAKSPKQGSPIPFSFIYIAAFFTTVRSKN